MFSVFCHLLAVFPTFLKLPLLRRFTKQHLLSRYCSMFSRCVQYLQGVRHFSQRFVKVGSNCLETMVFFSLLRMFPQFLQRCFQKLSPAIPFSQDFSDFSTFHAILRSSPQFPIPYSGTLPRPCFHSVCAFCLQSLVSNSEGDAFDCPRCGRRTQKMCPGGVLIRLAVAGKLGCFKKIPKWKRSWGDIWWYMNDI